MQRRVKRKVDTRLLPGCARFARQALARANQFAVIIRHVDDRGDTPCRGRAGRPDEILLAFLAAAMDLSVDCTGKNQAVAIIVEDRAGGSLTTPDLRNSPVGNRHETVVNDLTGKNDPASHDAVDRVHPICSRCSYQPLFQNFLRGSARGSLGVAARTRAN